MMAPFQPPPPEGAGAPARPGPPGELHRAWIDFFESNYRVDGSIEHTREYLLVLGVRI